MQNLGKDDLLTSSKNACEFKFVLIKILSTLMDGLSKK